jgi:hypothetical protein
MEIAQGYLRKQANKKLKRDVNDYKGGNKECIQNVRGKTLGIISIVTYHNNSFVFWRIMPCSPLKVSRRFGRTFHFGSIFDNGGVGNMLLRNLD